MPDFIKLAEILGSQVKSATELLNEKILNLEKEISRLREENKELAKIDNSKNFETTDKKFNELNEKLKEINKEFLKSAQDKKEINESDIITSVTANFERRFSDLILSWERQVRDETNKALDKIPTPKNGVDGLPAEAIEIKQNEREVTIKVGEVEKTIILDTILDRGVHENNKEYEKGDGVTLGGSFWIAQEKTKETPGTLEGSKSWRLAVKKGRDGKDLRDNTSTFDKTKGVKI